MAAKQIAYDNDARERILDVTAALVLEHGVAGVAQRQIAERVGIKAASLYHHFGSKNEIVEAVFRQGIDVMEHAWDEAAAATSADPRTRLATHIRAHLSALFENGSYTAAHVTAFRTAPAEVRGAVVPMRDACFAVCLTKYWKPLGKRRGCITWY